MSRESAASIASTRRAWVDRWPKDVKNALREAVVDGAEEVAELQRQLVPIGSSRKLHDSIGVTASLDGMKAFVVAGDTMSPGDAVSLTRRRSGRPLKAFYGVLVEYGTRFRPATPFFWPAWRALKPALKRRFARQFAKAFKSGAINRNPLG